MISPLCWWTITPGFHWNGQSIPISSSNLANLFVLYEQVLVSFFLDRSRIFQVFSLLHFLFTIPFSNYFSFPTFYYKHSSKPGHSFHTSFRNFCSQISDFIAHNFYPPQNTVKQTQFNQTPCQLVTRLYYL